MVNNAVWSVFSSVCCIAFVLVMDKLFCCNGLLLLP